MELATIEEYDIDIYSKEDCIEHINASKGELSEWVYKAYKLGEDDFNEVIKACEIGMITAYNYIKYEEAHDIFQLTENLNNSETSISLTQGVYAYLKGKTPQEREQNFQEVYGAIGRLPASYEIEVYNSLKSHAKNGDDLEKVDEILRYIVSASSSVKRKFRSSGNASYTLKKLYGAIQAEADESVIIGIADTGNLIATKSSKADKDKIRELEEKIIVLENKLSFFENSLSRKKIQQFMKLVDYTIKNLKKVGGDEKLMLALKTIGVEATVDESELKKAYRDKVSIHHPDKGGDDTIFRKIVESNQIIKNHIKRITNG